MSVSISVATTVSTAGLDRMIAGFAAIPHIVAEFAEKVAASARANAPEETGELKATIRAVLDLMAAKIVAGEGLPDGRALFQEMGFHHYKSGQFIQNAYLLPALEEHRAALVAAIQAAIGGR